MPVFPFFGGSADDPQMADSGTALEILRKKFPGLAGDGNTAEQPQATPLFGGGTPPARATPADVPPPDDVGQPAFDQYTLPWMRQFKPPEKPPRIDPRTGEPYFPAGSSKAAKLGIILQRALQGAMAGQAAAEQAVIQSGGTRSGGVGIGFEAGYNLPVRQAIEQQERERGALQNRQLAQQVQAFPQTQMLGQMEKISTISKNQSDAILNEARTAAEKYKVVGGILYDTSAQGGPKPIPGTAAGAFIPASASMAAVAGIPMGTPIPAETASKLQALANDAPPSNADQINAEFTARYQVLNPGKPLPAAYTFKPGMTEADYKRIDGNLQATERAQGTKAQQDAVNAIRGQTFQLAQQAAQERQEKQGLTWVMWADPSGRTVAGPLSMARQAGAQNPALVPTEEVRNINDARQAVGLINKQGKNAGSMGILQLVNSLDKDGKLGVAASRMNAFLAGYVGISPGDDPRIITLLDKTQLLMTLTMKAHFGASGGRSPQMLEHFLSMANAKQMDGQTLRAGVQAIGNYMSDRAMIPDGAAGAGQGVSVTDPKGGVHTFPDQASADRFKKLAGIK